MQHAHTPACSNNSMVLRLCTDLLVLCLHHAVGMVGMAEAGGAGAVVKGAACCICVCLFLGCVHMPAPARDIGGMSSLWRHRQGREEEEEEEEEEEGRR